MLPITPISEASMKLLSPLKKEVAGENPATETILLSGQLLDYVARVSGDIDPAMHRAFGWPHAICTIIDRFAQSGIDLTEASSESELAELAARQLRAGNRRRTASARSFSSASFPLADRPAYRSNLPATGRCRSGKPPR